MRTYVINKTNNTQTNKKYNKKKQRDKVKLARNECTSTQVPCVNVAVVVVHVVDAVAVVVADDYLNFMKSTHSIECVIQYRIANECVIVTHPLFLLT